MRALAIAGTSELVSGRVEQLRGSGVVQLADDFDDFDELDEPTGAVVLLDPGDRGDPALIQRLARSAPVIVVPGEAQPDLDLAWSLIRAGAFDVVPWDDALGAESIGDRFSRWQAVRTLCDSPLVRSIAVGSSAAWRTVVREVVEVAAFTSATVLITGETGTGKEVISRLVHALDSRPDKGELVVVDCASVMPSLSGSELFGHEKGSFTGAVATRRGAFELADGGTLFLDELGELPLGVQAELLRAIQERSYRRVGSHQWRRSEFRLVCATNRDLEQEVDRGGFRRDLFHRVAEWRCHLPPLRDRRDDVLPLARHFLHEFAPGTPGFDPAVGAFLILRDYPGNARDLRQLVARLAHRHVGRGPVTLGAIPEAERAAFGAAEHARAVERLFDDAARVALAGGATLKRVQHEAAEAAIRTALADANGRLHGAAQRLGVTDRALQMRRKAAERRSGDEVIDVS